MEFNRISEMVRGWFVGDFSPSVFQTTDVEVGVKTYRAGDHEERHYHKVATEITCIVSGEVTMNGRQFGSGDIITILPLESTDFSALTDATTVVVKIPGASNDKYLGSPYA